MNRANEGIHNPAVLSKAAWRMSAMMGMTNGHRLIAGDACADLAGYICAGGRSSRFGSNKARALVAGRPMIRHIAGVMLACLDSVSAVAGCGGAYEDLGIRTIADLSPGNGPMAALQAALHDRGHGWIFLVSCDMLSLRWHWIRELAQHRTGKSLAIAFRHSHWEPMCALYHTDLREQVDRRISAGRLSMQELLQEIPASALPMPGNWPRIAQANTQQDLHVMLADLFLPGFDLFKLHP